MFPTVARTLKLRSLLVVFGWWCLYLTGSAQSSSDCIGALPFCSGPGQGQAVVSPGDGNVHNETVLSCVDNEGYSTWFTFSPTSAGIFRFELTPVNVDDDYDWALFNITGHDCSDIPLDETLLVSCNSWGDVNNNGPTGISSAMGGTGNQNGPGNTNGPPFNADVQVQAGETYVLMVSNWSESTEGFHISVLGSTAEGIYRKSGVTGFDDQEVCKGDTATVDIDITGTIFGGLTYLWTPVDLFQNATAEDPVFVAPLEETTEISLFFTNGPCTYRHKATYFVGTMEYDKENLNQDVCVGVVNKLGIDFTGVQLPSGLKYHWFPEELVSNPLAANPYTVKLYDTTQFYLELRNGPCYAFDSLTLFVHYDTVKAAFDVYLTDDEETVPIEADFVNTSVGNAYNEWTFGDGTSSEEEQPGTHLYPGYSTYNIELIVQSPSTFCVDTAHYQLVYPEVVYPNIITPNGDEKNDILRITGLHIDTDLIIYNRWGRVVFEQENYQHQWNAEGLSDGLYFLQFYGVEGGDKKGWVEVLR